HPAGVVLSSFVSSSSRRHTSVSRDWSSDVCSSDLRSIPNSTYRPLRSGLVRSTGCTLEQVYGWGTPTDSLRLCGNTADWKHPSELCHGSECAQRRCLAA